MLTDNHKFVARRRALVAYLRQQGIASERVLAAIGTVPRECFVSPTLAELAYEDRAFPIGSDQTISQPYTVARQTDLLCLAGGEKVLEVGTGSGYQTAVLVACGCQVYSLERIAALHEQTRRRLSQLGYTAQLRVGDGYEGWASAAPFDRVIITAGTRKMPEQMLGQMAVGGIMVLPLMLEGELRLCRIVRKSESDYHSEIFEKCAFVPMLEGVVR